MLDVDWDVEDFGPAQCPDPNHQCQFPGQCQGSRCLLLEGKRPVGLVGYRLPGDEA